MVVLCVSSPFPMQIGASMQVACLLQVACIGCAVALPDISVELDGESLETTVSQVSFSPMGQGEYYYRWFVIRNAGTTALSGLSASVSGANGGDFTAGALPPSLAAGASVSFVVSFSPVGYGSRTATLSFTSNDNDENPFLIGLWGYGFRPIESWRLFYFGDSSNTGEAADDADTDQDGVSNLLEFCFNTDPLVADRSNVIEAGGAILACGFPSIRWSQVENAAPQALFLRRKDRLATGLTYLPQFSSDLIDWEDPAESPTVLVDDLLFELVSVPYPPLFEDSSTSFFRLVVQHTE